MHLFNNNDTISDQSLALKQECFPHQPEKGCDAWHQSEFYKNLIPFNNTKELLRVQQQDYSTSEIQGKEIKENFKQ